MTQLRIWGISSLAVALAVVGCNGNTMDHDAGRDSGPAHDMGGPVDFGPPVDGGGVDLGHDAGMLLDGAAPMCPTGACNLADGTGCPTGQACQLAIGATGTVSLACQPAGTGTSGSHCMTNADCAEGFECGGTTCQHYCCTPGSAVGCPTGQSCNVSIVDMMMHDTGAGLCSNTDDACDPIHQTGCPTAGDACYPGTGVTVCAAPGTTAAGATCTHTNDCMAGAVCVGTPMFACHQICALAGDAGVASTCPGGVACAMVTGYTGGVGICP